MANIKNELNNIKNAMYGKDVRSSIHDGINAINNEVESTTSRQVDLENTFDQLIINAGNSNAEIVDARVKSDGTSYSKLGDRLNEVDSQLAHIKNKYIVNVEDFKGVNDKEKIQNGINFAITQNAILEFTKMYDITNQGSIEIIKPYPYIDTLFIKGHGGGIIKNDTGFIFSNKDKTLRMSDFNITGMSFKSTNKTDEINVWDGDCFLRINSYGNFYKGISSVIKCVDVIVQSCRFSNEIIRGGNSYAFFSKVFIDFTVKDCLIEDRNSGWGYAGGGISNTCPSSQVNDKISNYNIRIENNVIEGMELCGVKLGSSASSTIKGNYMEWNKGGYFDLSTLADVGYNKSIDFSSNHIQQSEADVSNNIPALKISRILPENDANYKNKSSCFFSNNRSLGLLYETDKNSVIYSIGDTSDKKQYINNKKNIIFIGGINLLPGDVNIGSIDTYACGVAYFYTKSQQFTLSGSEQRDVSIQVTNAHFGTPLSLKTTISITSSNLNISVLSYNYEHVSSNVGKVNLRLKNTSSESSTSIINLNIINPND